MGQAVLRHRIFKRLCDMRLANQVIKCLRPVFARKDFVAHELTLSRSQTRERSKEVDATFQRRFLSDEAAGKPLLLYFMHSMPLSQLRTSRETYRTGARKARRNS